ELEHTDPGERRGRIGRARHGQHSRVADTPRSYLRNERPRTRCAPRRMAMDFAPSARSAALMAELVDFDDDIVRPAEPIYRAQRDESGDPHFPPPVMEELKTEARKRGLWNMFMPEGEYGIQLSNLDYAPLCEVMGGSPLLSEATNCAAPDTGNMEILA